MKNLFDEISELKSKIYSIKSKRKNNSFSDKRKLSIRDGIKEDLNKSNFKIDEINFGNKTIYKLNITFLRFIIPYLDTNSIINISLTNKQFYYFIHSIFCYKIISINTPTKIPIKNKNEEETKNTSFFNKLTGALFYFPSVGNLTSNTNENKIKEELKEKINIHKQLLLNKKECMKLSSKINEYRNKIDSILDKKLKENDMKIEKLKIEKIKKNYTTIKNEIDVIKNKIDILNKNNESIIKQDEECKKKINMIYNYKNTKFV